MNAVKLNMRYAIAWILIFAAPMMFAVEADLRAQFASPADNSSAYLSRNYINVNVSANFASDITIYLYNGSGSLLSSFGTSAATDYFHNFSSLGQGLYYFNATACNSTNATLCNSTETRNVTLDTTNPTIIFKSPTENSGAYLSRNSALINVTASDANFKNLTIYYYNSTGLYYNVSGAFMTSLSDNRTSLAEGVYYINATAFDLAGNLNKTETRNFTVDTANPAIVFMSPTTNSSAIANSITVNVSVSDPNFKNVTVRLYNAAKVLINQTWSTSANYMITFSSTLGTSVYYWNATAYDLAGHSNSTGTRNASIDRTNPTISFVAPTDTSGTYVARAYIFAKATAADARLKNVTIYLYNSTGLYNVTTTTATNLSINWTALPDGTYYINATAFDNANNLAKTETRNVTIDTANPAIVSMSPTTNSSSLTGTITVNVSVTDANFKNVTVRLYSSTGVLKNQTWSTSANYMVTLNLSKLPDGVYYFNATTYDKAGHSNSTATRNATVDATKPVVRFVFPTYNSSLYTDRTYIAANATASDVNLKNLTIYLYNSTELYNVTTTTATNLSINWTALPDGTYYINATAFDNANNLAKTETRNVTIDTVNPAIVSMSPTTNSSALTNVVIVNISVTDANFKNVTIMLYNASGALKNQTWSTSSGYMATFNFSKLPNGVYYFNATAYDKAGHSNSTETRNATIDTTNPAIRFMAPSQNTTTYSNRSYIAVNVTVNDTSLKNVTIFLYNATGLYNVTNGTAANLFVNWTALPDGTYYINATAYDNANNFNKTATRSVVIDVTNPAISFVNPTPGESSNLSRTFIAVNVSAADLNQNNITIRLYNASSGALIKAVTVSGNKSFYNFTGLKNGRYAINATAYDKFGHMNKTETRNIALDTVAPTLSTSNPANNSVFLSSSVFMSFVTTDAMSQDIACGIYSNGSSVANVTAYSGITFSDVYAFSDGVNSWYIRCVDSAGNNATSATLKFTVDTTNPAITFTSPSDNTSLFSSRPYIAVNVSAADANIKNTTVRLYNSTGGFKNESYSASSSVFVNFTLLADGLYYWNATAYDKFGHMNSTETRNATIDATNPAILFMAPTTNATSYSALSYISVNATASDANLKNLTIYLYNATGLYNVSATAATNLSINWTELPDGTYYINATAFDNAGNFNKTETRSIMIDTVNPAISFTTPTDNDSIYISRSSIAINVSASDGNFANLSIFLYNSTGGIARSNSTALTQLFVNYTGLADGIYYFNATAYDSANNINNTETRNVTIDTVNPAILLVEPTMNTTSYSALSYISVNATASDANLKNLTIYLYNATGLYNVSATAATNLSINWTALPDGQYYINATAFDSANSFNKTETRSINIDTANPVILFTTPTDNSSTYLARSNLVINVSASDSSYNSTTITLYNATGGIARSNSTALTQLFVNYTGLADGLYYWNATAYDNAGHINSTETRNATIDATGPVILFTAPTTNATSYSALNYIFANVTAIDTNLKNVTIYLYNATGLYNVSATAATNLSINWTELPDGVYSINATVFDNANNMNKTETRSITIDTANPAIQFVTPSTNTTNYTKNAYIQVNVSASDANFANLTVLVYNSTGLYASATTPATSFYNNWTGLADDIYYWNATAYDTVGKFSYTETRNVTIDTVAPVITLYTPASDDVRGPKPVSIFTSFKAVDAVASTMACNIYTYNASSGLLYNSTAASATNNVKWNVTYTYNYTGGYTWYVNCTDYVSNLGTSATWNFTVTP